MGGKRIRLGEKEINKVVDEVVNYVKHRFSRESHGKRNVTINGMFGSGKTSFIEKLIVKILESFQRTEKPSRISAAEGHHEPRISKYKKIFL